MFHHACIDAWPRRGFSCDDYFPAARFLGRQAGADPVPPIALPALRVAFVPDPYVRSEPAAVRALRFLPDRAGRRVSRHVRHAGSVEDISP